VPAFVVAQFAGAVLAVLSIRVLYPNVHDVAERVVVPHATSDEASDARGGDPRVPLH
jgi:hypothetical protein